MFDEAQITGSYNCASKILSAALSAQVIINPRRACAERVTVVILCICYHSNCHIPGLYVENKVSLGFSWPSQRMYSKNCVDFVENALFKSSGDMCADYHHLFRLLMSSQSMKRTALISRLVVCRCSDSSYNSTDSSLLTIDYQACFLGLLII